MTPTAYMQRYLNMWLILDNFEIATVKNDRYRNNGIASTRAPDADKIKDLINGSVAAESKTRMIENCFIDKLAVYDAFIGKASPENIVNVLWMAHRYGFIANPKKPKAPGGYKPLLKAQDFCDKYTGLDCNGFAANYYGLSRGEHHSVGSFAPQELRVKTVEEITARCCLVFFKGGKDKHIAVLESAEVAGETLKLKLVQSSGLTYGLNVKDWDVTIPADLTKEPKKSWVLGADRHGHLCFLDGNGRTTYACRPRTDRKPNP